MPTAASSVSRPSRTAPRPANSWITEEHVQQYRCGGRVPQLEFPIGGLYAPNIAEGRRHAALTAATKLAWSLIDTEASRKQINIALQTQDNDDDASLPSTQDTDVERRITAWLDRQDTSLIVNEFLPWSVWGTTTASAYAVLQISEDLVTRAEHLEQVKYDRAVLLLGLTVARLAVDAMRMGIACEIPGRTRVAFNTPRKLKATTVPLQAQSPTAAADRRTETAESEEDTRGQGGWWWAEHFLGGALGFVFDHGARCIAEVVYARMGEDGVPRWFKLADEHVHLLAVDATAWPIYRRYPTEQWNRGLVPDNVLFRGDPQQASAPANSRPSVSWSDVNWRYNGCGTAAAKAHR